MELFEKNFNPELYKTDFHWKEGDHDVYRVCHWSAPGCHDSCGILLYVKDGKLDRVEGDPNQPYNRGRLCMRCLNLPEACNETLDRLKWPVKRVGERGENKWERISWDEAYDIIVENVRRIQETWGPESICGMIGTGRNVCWQNPLICYAGFGTPNMALVFSRATAAWFRALRSRSAYAAIYLWLMLRNSMSSVGIIPNMNIQKYA